MKYRTNHGSPTTHRRSRSFIWRLLRVGIAALIVAALCVLLYRGNTTVKLTQYTNILSNLPAEFDGFTIVHLSDLHNAQYGAGQERLLSRVREADADVIVITGDVIDSRRTNVDRAVETLALLRQIAPVYFVTGNHESRIPAALAALLAGAETVDAVPLRNTSVLIERNGQQLQIAGVDDLSFFTDTYGSRAGKTRFCEQLTRFHEASVPTVLLSHRPELFELYVQSGADLVLCGHAHGGQIRIPGIGGIFAPGQGFFPQYTAGIHRQEDTSMIISRGLYSFIMPPRIFNPPEVIAVTLCCDP